MAGMHALACGQLSDCFLQEEQSQQVVERLQERSLQSRPLAWCGRLSQDLNPLATKVPSRRRAERDSLGHVLRKFFCRHMPILQALPSLTRRTLRADFLAGLTVGVMVIPQGMSYASIAGLDYVYGMYSACVPAFAYVLFGQSRQLAVGPVALVSLLVAAGLKGALTEKECPESYSEGQLLESVAQNVVCKEAYTSLVILTAAVVGVLQLLASILRLGFLVSFLGHPVTSGFMSASAVIIGMGQVRYLLGLKLPSSELLQRTVSDIIGSIHLTQPITLGLGLVWLAFLIVSKQLAQRNAKVKALGYMAPLISCVLGGLLIFTCVPLREKVKYVGDHGHLPRGLMPFTLPVWQLQHIWTVLPTSLSVCLIGYMESIAISKNLAAKHGYEIEAGQELFALGASNLLGAMFSCYPVTGSFSRSAVNHSSGALTQVAGLITSLMMLLTLLFLTPIFEYLPNFVLGAIVISSVIPLVAFNEAIKLWRIKKQDFLLWACAFLGTLLLGVLEGIAIAVGISLALVLFESARPQITILWRIPGTTIYRSIKQEGGGAFLPNVFIARLSSSMHFANAAFIRDMLLAYTHDLQDVNPTEYVVLDMTPVVSIDSTAVHVLQEFVHEFRSRGVQVAFAVVGHRVHRTLRKAELIDFIGEQWFFPTVDQAVVFCLSHQQARRTQASQEARSLREEGNSDAAWPPGCAGSEIGVSNDAHHAFTAVFASVGKGVPMVLAEITGTFKKYQISVKRAYIETTGEGDEEHAKHTYFVRSLLHPGKLLKEEMVCLQEELQAAVRWREEGSEQRRLGGGASSGEEGSGRELEASDQGLAEGPANLV